MAGKQACASQGRVGCEKHVHRVLLWVSFNQLDALVPLQHCAISGNGWDLERLSGADDDREA